MSKKQEAKEKEIPSYKLEKSKDGYAVIKVTNNQEVKITEPDLLSISLAKLSLLIKKGFDI